MLHTPHSLAFNSAAASFPNLTYLPGQSPRAPGSCSGIMLLPSQYIHLRYLSADFPPDLVWYLQDLLLEQMLPDSFFPFTHPCLTQVFIVAWVNSLWAAILGYWLVLKKDHCAEGFDSLLTNTMVTQEKGKPLRCESQIRMQLLESSS